MHKATPTRRAVVMGAVAAGTLPPGLGAKSDLARRLAPIIPDRASARRVGRAWLAANPRTAERARLVGQALAALALDRNTLAGLDDTHLYARAAARIRADFAHGHTIVVDGWMLSRTETLLCAVAAVA